MKVFPAFPTLRWSCATSTSNCIWIFDTFRCELSHQILIHSLLISNYLIVVVCEDDSFCYFYTILCIYNIRWCVCSHVYAYNIYDGYKTCENYGGKLATLSLKLFLFLIRAENETPKHNRPKRRLYIYLFIRINLQGNLWMFFFFVVSELSMAYYICL